MCAILLPEWSRPPLLPALFDRHQVSFYDILELVILWHKTTLILIIVFIEGNTMDGLGHESCFMGWVEMD